jgi:Mg-chelatase subunit ChlD
MYREQQEHAATRAPGFTVEVFQNEYLPGRGREVNAIVTVTSAGSVTDGPAPAQSAAEIIILDCSGSMTVGWVAKLARAEEAAGAAIDAIRDGVAFAVVAGTERAWPVYPADGTTSIASRYTREAARGSLAWLRASGRTAIGNWLLKARGIFLTREDTLRHAILLTDGRNGQFSRTLASAIRRCGGVPSSV